MSNWELYQPMMRFANERIKQEIDHMWSLEHVTADAVTEDMCHQGVNLNEEEILIIIRYNDTVIDIFVNLKAQTGSSVLFNTVKRLDNICKLYQTASYAQGR